MRVGLTWGSCGSRHRLSTSLSERVHRKHRDGQALAAEHEPRGPIRADFGAKTAADNEPVSGETPGFIGRIGPLGVNGTTRYRTQGEEGRLTRTLASSLNGPGGYACRGGSLMIVVPTLRASPGVAAPVRMAVRGAPPNLSQAVLDSITRSRYDRIVVMDADLSHPPERIPDLLAAIDRGGCDTAVGSRYVAGASTAGEGGLTRVLKLTRGHPASGTPGPMAGPKTNPAAPEREYGAHPEPALGAESRLDKTMLNRRSGESGDDPRARRRRDIPTATTATGAIILAVLLMLASTAGVAEGQDDGVGGLFAALEPELPANASAAASSIFPNVTETRDTPGIRTMRSRLVRVAFEQLATARASAIAADAAGRVLGGGGGAVGPGAAPGTPASLTLNLFDDVQLSAVVERAAPTASGTGYALSGRIDENGERSGDWTLLVYGDGGDETVVGTANTSTGTFIIKAVGDGVHAVSEVDTSTLPPPGEPLLPPAAPDAPEDSSPPAVTDPPSASASGSTRFTEIDVAVFYTRAARDGAGHLLGSFFTKGITKLVDLMFENANAAYQHSGVDQRIRLVAMEQVAYRESRDPGRDLDRLMGTGDKFMREVHAKRATYGADLVHLISDAQSSPRIDNHVCGIAFGLFYRGYGPDYSHLAFGLTDYRCEIGDYTFAHELGHNMGLQHDRFTESGRNPENGWRATQSIKNSPRAYGFGYVNQEAFPRQQASRGAAWNTIMAYDLQCEAEGYPSRSHNDRRQVARHCRTLRNFSNPNLLERGDRLGVFGTRSSQRVNGPAHAARLLNETRGFVANFRERKVRRGASIFSRNWVSTEPDLVVQSPTVSDTTLTPDQSFTFSATVRNEGGSASMATTLIYYRRRLAGGDWTAVGRDDVGRLAASRGSLRSIVLTAPAQAGSYQYRACDTPVSGESDTDNNCSTAVRVTVSSNGTSGGCSNDLGTVSGTVERTGSWDGSCQSEDYPEAYARYYSFTLRERALVTIDLTSSSVDTWLVLYSGAGTGREWLTSDDDGGAGTNARVRRALPAGTYTIEATTLLDGVTGDFTLTLAVDQVDDTGAGCTNDLGTVSGKMTRNGSWTGTASVLQSRSARTRRSIDLTSPVSRRTTRMPFWSGEGRYARYYSFTLSENASVTIDLTSPSVDTYLVLRYGSGTGSGLVDDDDDSGAGANARIGSTLAAGTYTIEAMPFWSGETGDFTLTLGADQADQGRPGAGPDLVVQWPAASEATLVPGQPFTFSATVRNAGGGEAAATTLVYRHRPEGESWTEVGTDVVDVANAPQPVEDRSTARSLSSTMRATTGLQRTCSRSACIRGRPPDVGRCGLSASFTSHEWIRLTAPMEAGVHDYAACVETVSGESDTDNNCSSLVRVTVKDYGDCMNDLGTMSGTVERAGSWTGSCLSVHYPWGEYARYYSFTLSGDASVTIDLTSPSVDTWLALYSGAGVGNERLAWDNDGGDDTNARITRALAADTYTIEATTLLGGVTGDFTLTLTFAPDLVVESPAVSESFLIAGQPFTFSATVRNAGASASPATTLTYWRRRPVEESWTAVDTDPVDGLAASETSQESVDLTAPTQAGGYYYAACVSSVSGESDSDNNCSGLAAVNVSAGGTGTGCRNDLGAVSGTVTRHGSWTDNGCLSVHFSEGEYARYYSFTLTGSASVTIDLTSPSADTYLALRNGSGAGSDLVDYNDDSETGTDSRITRTLAAGAYTIEATTFWGGETGQFTLTLVASQSGEPLAKSVFGRVLT